MIRVSDYTRAQAMGQLAYARNVWVGEGLPETDDEIAVALDAITTQLVWSKLTPMQRTELLRQLGGLTCAALELTIAARRQAAGQ